MSTFANPNEPLAIELEVTDDELIVSLADGRRLSVPIAWYPRLANATPEQRRNWEIVRNWPSGANVRGSNSSVLPPVP